MEEGEEGGEGGIRGWICWDLGTVDWDTGVTTRVTRESDRCRDTRSDKRMCTFEGEDRFRSLRSIVWKWWESLVAMDNLFIEPYLEDHGSCRIPDNTFMLRINLTG